jgi:fibronectin-binding autotransporter adhesin
MKFLRLLFPLVFGLAAVAAVLAWGAQAAEASGTVSPCNEGNFDTALSGGGLVTFNCGGPATITATAMQIIGADTTIDGFNGGNPLTLTANSNVLMFIVQSGKTLTLTNLTIAGVNSSQGAIIYNGGLVISNAKFLNNANYGVEGNGPLTITNSIIRGNTGVAAVEVSQNGRLSVTNSQFISNTGYAIWTRAAADVSDSQFFSNTTTGAGAGAGIFLDDSGFNPLTLTVTSSQFMTNSAYGGGGAIYASGGLVTISNTLFISNSTTNGGGALSYQAILARDGLQVLSSTFRRNNNSAISVNGSGGAPFLLADSIIQDNLGPTFIAGVASGGSNLTVSHTHFIHNVSTANYAGALESGGPVTITDSLFENNTGQYSGAAFMDNGGGGSVPASFTDTVTGSAFWGNTATGYDGGGIYVSGASLIVADSVFSDNVNSASSGLGGGLAWWNDANPIFSLNVSRSLFYNNQATNGGTGGGAWVQGNATIDNSTFYSNSAATTGGIHLSNSSSLTLTNDTLAGNTATSIGSAGNLLGGSIFSPAALVNTILAGGSPKNCGGTIASLGHNLSSDATCPLTATGDLSGTNPLLGAFQDNGGPSWTIMPTAASPAINAGDNANCPSVDQRGVARPVGPACDIGAVEASFKTPQTISFGPLAAMSIRTAPFNLSATATSGLAVSFVSLTPAVCGVSGSTVTLETGGTCTLRAQQAGDSTYAAAPNVDQGFLVLTHILFLPAAMRSS